MSFLITATLNYQAARAQEELHEQNLLELEAEELGGGEHTAPAGDGAGGAVCAAPCSGWTKHPLAWLCDHPAASPQPEQAGADRVLNHRFLF